MLQQILALLGIETPTPELSAKLNAIISITSQRLCLLLNAEAVPDSLSYIVTEVSIIRFNRIGSEGVSSHHVQGESMTWSDKDFAPYRDEMQAYLDAQADPTTNRGRISFI